MHICWKKIVPDPLPLKKFNDLNQSHLTPTLDPACSNRDNPEEASFVHEGFTEAEERLMYWFQRHHSQETLFLY